MTRRAWPMLVAVGLSAAIALQAKQRPPAGDLARGRSAIDEVLASAVARHAVPGLVAIATDRRAVLYQGAFGLADVTGARPLTVDAVFRIASMTKPITSVAAMQLVEQGRLSLDDPAAKYLPALANLSVFDSFDSATGAYTTRPATKALTVRHLFSHTSGLGYGFTSPIVRDFKPRAGEQYSAGPLLFEPGDQWIYGTSTDWLGRLVESVSGKTLDDYFREHVLGPLSMADTFYNVPADKQNRLVAAHQRQADGSVVTTSSQPAATVTSFGGGGGLFSTANDYIRFVQALLNEGTLGGRRILSADSVALMRANHIGRVGVRALKTAQPERSSDFAFVADGRDKWGLGFLITADARSGLRSPGSMSWGGINNTYFWVDPVRGIGGVILMQFLPFADREALAVYEAFERAVYALVDGRP